MTREISLSAAVFTILTVGRCRTAELIFVLVGSSKFHINHGISDEILVAEWHDAVVEVLHDAAFGSVELSVRPLTLTPSFAEVLRSLFGILGELDSNDECSENNNFRTHGVDVYLIDVGRG